MASGQREAQRLQAVQIAACVNADGRKEVGQFIQKGGELAEYRKPEPPRTDVYMAAWKRARALREKMERGERN